jgi:hydroxypyruvate isomerase
VTSCLENLNTVVDHPGAPFARAKETPALVEAVARRGPRMILDLYHAQIGEGNLIELLERANSLIGEVQVADVPGRCEPGHRRDQLLGDRRSIEEDRLPRHVGLEAYVSAEDDVALERFSSTFGAGAPT